MGLDLLLVRVKQPKDNDRWDIDYCGDEFGWDDTRYVCRHRFLNELEFNGISTDEGYFYRPKSFSDARKFALTTDAPEYINKMLDILEQNNDLYFEINR
jgi:hypothetical protein